ncbi:MAG TPA: efflux transporter outer membrane subunit [Steroidobacteraceae bacterium]|nr:efflux transporter outer membrane subunit [Steroidobacteraceae bacterium]
MFFPGLRWWPLVVATTLSACAVGPDYRPPTPAVLALPEGYSSQPGPALDEGVLRLWWQRFDDPLLADLVTRAAEYNHGVEAASARLRVARAALRGSRGAFWPTLDASLDANTTDVSDTRGGAVESWQAGFDAGWEIDLFGGTRRSVEAARAELHVAEATLADVRNSIAAEVALNYIEARSAQARIRVARDNLGYQDETLQIAQWRNQAGLVSSQDVEQATVQRSQTAAAVPQLRATYAAAANRIAVLTGQAPGQVTARLDVESDIPVGPDDPATGVPAELLRRRPDLVAAERALAAEVARIGVAESRLYPALRLGGSIGSAAASLGDVGSVLTTTLGSSLAAPLFQGGQLRAQLQGQRASADAALANYEGAVLGAVEDVENALTAMETSKEREATLLVAEQAADRSALLARARYRSGLADFESLLEANRSLLTTQESRLTAKAARATAVVQLFKALGGGWPPQADTMTRR